MKVTTTCIAPPEINLYYDSDLLLENWQRIYKRVKTRVIPLSERKIRSQDTGKRKDFDKLLQEFDKVYAEREIEKADYEAKKKEAYEKRPCFPTTSRPMQFRRYVSEKSDR